MGREVAQIWEVKTKVKLLQRLQGPPRRLRRILESGRRDQADPGVLRGGGLPQGWRGLDQELVQIDARCELRRRLPEPRIDARRILQPVESPAP